MVIHLLLFNLLCTIKFNYRSFYVCTCKSLYKYIVCCILALTTWIRGSRDCLNEINRNVTPHTAFYLWIANCCFWRVQNRGNLPRTSALHMHSAWYLYHVLFMMVYLKGLKNSMRLHNIRIVLISTPLFVSLPPQLPRAAMINDNRKAFRLITRMSHTRHVCFM